MNNIFKFSFYIFLTLAFAWLAFVVGAKNQYGDLEPTAESLEEDGPIRQIVLNFLIRTLHTEVDSIIVPEKTTQIDLENNPNQS